MLAGRRSAQDNLADPAEFGVFCYSRGDIASPCFDHYGAQLFSELYVGQQSRIFGAFLSLAVLNIQSRKVGMESVRHSCGRADDPCIAGGSGKTDENMFLDLSPPASGWGFSLGGTIDPIRHAAQGYFTQTGKVGRKKEVFQRPLGLFFPVNFSGFQPEYEFFRFNVDKLHLVGLIKNVVRQALAYDNSGDGCHQIVETFKMLNIDGRPDGNTRPQNLFNILIALGVAAAVRVGVGQFVHQKNFRLARQRRIHIKFIKGDISVGNTEKRELFKTIKQCGCFRAGMGFDITGDDVYSLRLGRMRGLEHGGGLAHSGGIAEEDFQHSFPGGRGE